MQLGQLAQGRDNNFNLIRIVAAASVLVTHSFALVTGDKMAEPLRAQLGLTLGSFAVDIFFFTSGFLVMASLLKRQSLIEFSWARCLRIFPALYVMLTITVFALAPCFSTLPTAQYFADPGTYRYLARASVLLFGVVDRLPGVFEDNPIRGGFNGSLWTMPYELWMYVTLGLAWLTLGVLGQRRLKVLQLAVVCGAVLSTALLLVSTVGFDRHRYYLRLPCLFFQGAAYYTLRHRIRLSRPVFFALLALLIVSSAERVLFHAVYPFALGYLILWLAYVPGGWLRAYNKLGDYSYGVYIYAFPIQQALIVLVPAITVMQLIASAGALTLCCAVLSWHLLEKRALGYKEFFVQVSRRALVAASRRAAT
jgi:peptidoglycan/LPS O-acetylase OafA/YrhL